MKSLQSNCHPQSDLIWHGTPNLDMNSSTSFSTTALASMFGTWYTSTHLENLSTTIRAYLFPEFGSGNCLNKSMATSSLGRSISGHLHFLMLSYCFPWWHALSKLAQSSPSEVPFHFIFQKERWPAFFVSWHWQITTFLTAGGMYTVTLLEPSTISLQIGPPFTNRQSKFYHKNLVSMPAGRKSNRKHPHWLDTWAVPPLKTILSRQTSPCIHEGEAPWQAFGPCRTWILSMALTLPVRPPWLLLDPLELSWNDLTILFLSRLCPLLFCAFCTPLCLSFWVCSAFLVCIKEFVITVPTFPLSPVSWSQFGGALCTVHTPKKWHPGHAVWRAVFLICAWCQNWPQLTWPSIVPFVLVDLKNLSVTSFYIAQLNCLFWWETSSQGEMA